jgi:peptide/nickel transport system substrate-binding protein
MRLLSVPCIAVALLAGLACGHGDPPVPRLRILLTGDILGVEPNRDLDWATDSVLFNVFEPLVGLDDNLELRTQLADSWEHPTPERWRFHLRRGVRYHDGTPLTAPAVRDVLLSVRDARGSMEAASFLDVIEQIEAPDEHTLELVTRKPRALLQKLPFLYVTRPRPLSGFPLQGTGPYRLESRVPGRQVTLRRSPHWRGPAPQFDEVVFEVVEDAAERLARVQRGEAEIAYEIPPELIPQASPAQLVRRSGLSVVYLGMDVRPAAGNPFARLETRQAIHLALDRQAMVERDRHGSGEIATQPVAPTVFGFDPSLPRPVRDPDSARRLLGKAGLAEGFSVQLDFARSRIALAQRVRSSLAEIGIQVTLNPVDRYEIYDLARSGRSRFFLVAWVCGTGEAGEFYDFCLHTPGTNLGLGNYGGYSSRRLDEIAYTHGEALDARERQALLQEAARITMTDLPVLPLVVEEDIYASSGQVHWHPRADGEIRLLDVERRPAR